MYVRAESTFYPGMQYIVGSWYRKDELAKRSCLFRKEFLVIQNPLSYIC